METCYKLLPRFSKPEYYKGWTGVRRYYRGFTCWRYCCVEVRNTDGWAISVPFTHKSLWSREGQKALSTGKGEESYMGRGLEWLYLYRWWASHASQANKLKPPKGIRIWHLDAEYCMSSSIHWKTTQWMVDYPKTTCRASSGCPRYRENHHRPQSFSHCRAQDSGI